MTPHIEAKLGDIAKTVIMPGDPLRAKMIADTYLENVKLVNSVRNIYAFTGTYKGSEITVMASGMGMPSIGIYSYELYTVYNVENIIRIGTAGSYSDRLNVYDVMLADSCYSESSFAKIQNGEERNILNSSDEINEIIKESARELGIELTVGRLHSSDVFYKENNNFDKLRDEYGCLAVEMESFALFHNANVCGKKAACLITVSDSFITHEVTSAEERQNSLHKMIELALTASIKL